MLLKKLSIYLGTGGGMKGDEFSGFAAARGIRKKLFFYVSKNRYITYELLAKNVVDERNYAVISAFLDKEANAGFTGTFRATLVLLCLLIRWVFRGISQLLQEQ
jgi:hypothetical protein